MEHFMAKYDYIICDCDGVLWINNKAIDGVADALNKLRSRGKTIIFATNNSTKTREEFLAKLITMGIDANIKELFPSSYSVAMYLKTIGFKKNVYIIGCSGISSELESIDIKSIGVGPDLTPNDWSPGMAPVKLNNDIGAVIIGFDHHVSFPKLSKACSYLLNEKCHYIAANEDECYPSPEPEIKVPGPGAYVAAIKAVTGRDPIGVGKPHKHLFECIQRQYPKLNPMRTVMIGDRLMTDMVFAHNNGFDSLFVETGVNSIGDMFKLGKSEHIIDRISVPDYYLKSLNEFNKYL